MGTKKVKISAVKRSAHLRNKKVPLSKQQLQKLKQQAIAREKNANIFKKITEDKVKLAFKKQANKRKQQSINAGVDDDDDDVVDSTELANNVSDMLEDDDLDYLLGRQVDRKSRKRKLTLLSADNKAEDAEDAETNDDLKHAVNLEKRYAVDTAKQLENEKFTINLLPIKSREGKIIPRSTEVSYRPKYKEKPAEEQQIEGELEQEYDNSDDDVCNDADDIGTKLASEEKLISTTDLLIARQQEIERQRYRIGIICSGILEKPEDKLRNFKSLFELMDESTPLGSTNLLTVRKLAMVSITEIFKDILPEYRVGQVDTKMQHVRKATLARVTYENSLLQQFRKFLQRLERITAVVNRRNFGRITPQAIKLAEVAVECLSEILMAHPYFNYVKNVAQLLVFILNSKYARMRETVHKCFCYIFGHDKQLDMTLFIMRRINHLIKTKNNNVHLECITCLLALKIKNVNLDAEKENDMKLKKLEAHRQRVISLSRKERKRQKRLAALNKELEETRAEENKQSKHQKLTEIVKMLFNIYFRILKNDPNSKALGAILEGLAEFGHIINLDFFSDLINILNNILEEQEDLGYREKLHCIQTIFVILSGQGEALNIDPIRFYRHFYQNMMVINAGRNHEDFRIIIKTLNEVLVKRKQNMSQQRLMAFIKRLLTISLNVLHHGTLAILGTVKTTFQLSSVLDILLDTDCSVGSGKYDPELDDPEYCNAACTALYELSLLHRHYHPTVRKMAMYIANGVPPTGEDCLPSELGKLTNLELLEQFDSTEMVFNPAIPLPKLSENKKIKWPRNYLDNSFKDSYKQLLAKTKKNRTSKRPVYDFFSSII